MRHFKEPQWPMPHGIQDPADWPELPAAVIDRFNRWYDPEVVEEIDRRARQHLSMAFSDEIWLAHNRAAAEMELVRYARMYPGEHVSIEMFGFCGGMLLNE
jgi:hypothetical protein